MALTLNRERGTYTFTFKKRASYFTKDFLLALSIALLLHLMAIIFFRIDVGTLLKIYPELGNLSVLAAPKDSGSLSLLSDTSQEAFGKEFSFQISRKEAPTSLPPHFENQTLSPFHTVELPEEELPQELPPFYASLQLYPFPYASKPTFLKSSTATRAKVEFIADTKNEELIWLKLIESTGDSRLDKKIQAYLRELPLQISSKELFVRGTAIFEFRK